MGFSEESSFIIHQTALFAQVREEREHPVAAALAFGENTPYNGGRIQENGEENMDLMFCMPCLFGLEGLVGNELRHMGLRDVAPENGRVYFVGTEEDIARVNLRSRFGERLLLVLGRFPARTFDELFEGCRALPWEDYIPGDAAFPVTGWALESALHSVPDCQKIVKKAVVEAMKRRYRVERFPESGGAYQIRFGIWKDSAALYLDCSGVGLYKRGYRPAQVAAPLRETLAAAMVDIARYRGRGEFCDPFCGGGTVAIEAALAARNRAPGLYRHFAAESWGWLDRGIWERCAQEARDREFHGDYTILASDIDPHAVELARANALRAGVADIIRFEVADARKFARSCDRGTLVTNPPYGERMMEQREAGELYRDFGEAFRATAGWSAAIISSHPQFEKCFGARAAKRRKLYNGMIPCTLYLY